jgi:hypothetical protein
MNELYELLTPDEKALHDALVSIANQYGKFNEDGTGIWAGYQSAEDNEDKEIGVKCSNCSLYQGENVCEIIALSVEPEGMCRLAVIPDGYVQVSEDMEDDDMSKAISARVGGMVSWNSSGGTARGKIVRIVRNGSINVPNSEFTISGTPDNPAALIRIYRDGKPTETLVGHRVSTLRVSSSKSASVSKAEMNLKPNDGMKSAAARALQWKKEGKAGGTRVGLARANQIVNGTNLSRSTVARMYSFFSRHEVDKKATGFNSGEEGFPSPGRVAWDLWGGDAGFSWSRSKWTQIKNMKKWAGSAFDLDIFKY